MSEYTEFSEDSCLCGSRCAPGREVCETCFREGPESPEEREARVLDANRRAALLLHRKLARKFREERQWDRVAYYEQQCARLERELKITHRSVA